ncbi:MAG: hypothetical protein M5U34_41565 [Chloroflexi bacterium]|nr:hypothetical protein [Chloroflexota bacterium]
MAPLFLIRHANVMRDPAVSAHEWRLSANGRSRTIALARHLTTNSDSLPKLTRNLLVSFYENKG